MMKKWLIAAFSATTLALSAGASAQALTGFYAGAEFGQGEIGSEDDTAIKLLGGFQVNRNLAAEVAYSMLFDKGGAEVNALEVVGVGSFPLANQLSVFGKLGFANMETDGTNLDDGIELTWGLGVQYDVSQRLGVRAGWQRYETDPDEVDLLSIGVVYRF